MKPTSKSLLSISLYMHLSIFSLTPTQTPHGVMALFLYSSSLLHIPLFWFFFCLTSFVPHCFFFFLYFCSPPSFPFFVSQQVGIDQVDIPDLSQVSGTFHLNFCHVASPEILITTSPHRPPSPASPISSMFTPHLPDF